jgi:membrane-bound lytic murein transglycosylase A
MTGYYEPEIKAYNYKKSGTYPVYKINIEKHGKKIFNNSRMKINQGILDNKGLEIAWVDNEVEAFFLHIQGSGRLRFDNGTVKKIRYAGSNNKKYTAIGKVLIEQGAIKKNKVSMFSIKKWLYQNQKKARQIMEKNNRYIYFEEYQGEIKGSSNLDLIPFVSLAVDPRYYDIGDILLITDYKSKKSFLGIAHDTGAAIKGKNRVDLFTGYGKNAEKIAAELKQSITVKKLNPI